MAEDVASNRRKSMMMAVQLKMEDWVVFAERGACAFVAA